MLLILQSSKTLTSTYLRGKHKHPSINRTKTMPRAFALDEIILLNIEIYTSLSCAVCGETIVQDENIKITF